MLLWHLSPRLWEARLLLLCHDYRGLCTSSLTLSLPKQSRNKELNSYLGSYWMICSNLTSETMLLKVALTKYPKFCFLRFVLGLQSSNTGLPLGFLVIIVMWEVTSLSSFMSKVFRHLPGTEEKVTPLPLSCHPIPTKKWSCVNSMHMF